ncbi:MAG: TMF family protein [bacterium]|nr:TMF family protein [bacterium]
MIIKTVRSVLMLLIALIYIANAVFAENIYEVNGQFGMGTQTPSDKLDVVGFIESFGLRSGRSDGDLYLQIKENSDKVIIGGTPTDSSLSMVWQNGNVGIGRIPTRKLDVAGPILAQSTSPWVGVWATGTGGKKYNIISTDDTWEAGAGKFTIYDSTVGKHRLVVDATGNIGIGRIPTRKLDVAGPILAQDTSPWVGVWATGTGGKKYSIISTDDTWEAGAGKFTIYDSTVGKHRLVVDATGNIGIGTTNPEAPLQIGGTYGEPGYMNFKTPKSNFNIGVSHGGNEFWIVDKNDINYPSYFRFYIDAAGNVGIGTVKPEAKLDVNGRIKANEFMYSTNVWADFVFDPGYKLMPLYELESFVIKNRHLPGIFKENDVIASGVDLGNMQTKLLQKIEENVLYILQLNKKNKELKHIINNFTAKVEKVEKENQKLKDRIEILEQVFEGNGFLKLKKVSNKK